MDALAPEATRLLPSGENSSPHAAVPRPAHRRLRPLATRLAGAVLLVALLCLLLRPYASPATTSSPSLDPTSAASSSRARSAHRHRGGGDRAGHTKDCGSPRFKKETLKLVAEAPIARLAPDGRLDKYEASDVAGVPGSGELYVVSDNTFQIARFGERFAIEDAAGRGRGLLSWPGDDAGDESQFEFLAYNATGEYFVVGVESAVQEDGALRAHTFDVQFGENSTLVLRRCETEFEFSSENKGFEGAAIVEGGDGESYLLGLCEGNYCAGGKKGSRSGNGRIVVMRRGGKGGKCVYETVDMLEVPATADFQDYSALTVWAGKTVAIASQENAAIFVADLEANVSGEGPRFVWAGDQKVLDFPRNDACEIKYCNVEGLLFIGPKRIVAVSDAMKSKGRQHFRCREKDESVHLMALP